MKLLVDIGNSRAKFATSIDGGSFDIKIIDNSALSENWVDNSFSNISEVVLSSVASNQYKEVIEQWALSNAITCVTVRTESETFGVKNSYLNPEQMGVDRWLAIIGAHALLPNSSIILVDAGTATTVELIDGNKHLGGWILPGLELMFKSLQSQTSKVIAEPNYLSSLSLGKNTSECVNNALLVATLGLIEQAKKEAEKNQLQEPIVLLTGGNALKISAHLQIHNRVEPALVFYGMQRFGSN